MGMLEDVIKALERIPMWKRVSALPDKMEALEARIAQLEERLKPATGARCPACGEMAYKLISSKPLGGAMGRLGVNELSYACSACGHTHRKTSTD